MTHLGFLFLGNLPDEEPRKWVERGGTGTTKEWLYDRRAEMPNFAPESSMTQGPATSSQAASSSGGGNVVATPVDSSLLGGDVKSPLEPTESVSKRPRGVPEEAASAKAKYARLDKSFLRLKAPPPHPPQGMEAGAYVDMGEVQALSDEQVREEYAKFYTQDSWDEGPARPKPSSSRAEIPTSGTVTRTRASTNDPYQNVLSPSEQIKRREVHAAAALKRREHNLSRSDDADFREMIDIFKATHRSEINQIDKDRPLDADRTEKSTA